MNQEIQEFGGNSKIIKVKTFTLQPILDRHNITEIDLCSIDTEGAEMAVIQSIDFNKVKIECIVTENNYGEKNVKST
ncbi:FkbM family methyltransferase [Peribacillus butanolivorans]|uniref:FkbM family methyltransferase n=1 Tax=Peribacillus butanolivorans TaxID=421767 RepID=UPI0036D78701